MTGRRRAAAAALLLCLLAPAAPALARQVSGRLYEDRDGDGRPDPGEPGLSGFDVRLFGTPASGGAFDQSTLTDPAGGFSFAPALGCYLLAPPDPAGWRLGPSRQDDYPQGTAGYLHPVGVNRFASAAQAPLNLAGGSYRITAMGDSIARNFNFCTFPEAFLYNKEVMARLGCVEPAATFSLDQAAVLGEHTDDLLVDDTANLNNVFRVMAAQPHLITLSMIGNDLLDVDPGGSPTQAQINRAVAEILDARQNLQEALAAMTAGIPHADIVLNTLYDNEAYNCATGSPGAFHRTWLPIVNRILRDLAWGQSRRASIAEAAAEISHENQTGACLGFTGMICRDTFHFDDIHPTASGYAILREKLWEAAGGVMLGATAPLGPALPGADFGYLRRVRRLLPARWTLSGGAGVIAGDAALSDQDAGTAAAITLGAGAQEFRLSGFPDWYDEIEIVRVIAGVRYRTSGALSDDFYRMEASVTGQFRPPAGHPYSPTSWNFYTPIVGGGGPNKPDENPDYPTARVLAQPDVAALREASATLSKNPVLPPGGAEYTWPAVTAAELATTAIRVVAAPVAGTAGNDSYAVLLDAAWLDLYGWEKPRPVEVQNLFAEPAAGGGVRLEFDEIFGAQRYNVYAGRLASLADGAGVYDHGAAAPAGPFCAVPAIDIGAGRRAIDLAASGLAAPDLYLLVTAHVDDVETPAGVSSGGTEVDRSQSICR